MEVSLSTRSTPARTSPSFVAFGLFSGESSCPSVLPDAVREVVEDALAAGEVRTDGGEKVLLHGGKSEARFRVLILGLGAKAEFDEEQMRRAAGRAVRAAEEARCPNLTLVLPSVAKRAGEMGRSAVEGVVLGAWSFTELKAPPEPGKEKVSVTHLELLAPGGNRSTLNREIRDGLAAAEGTNLARTLQSRPGNLVTPTRLAEEARQMAEEMGLEIEIFDKKKLEKAGMHAILAVSRGSVEEPRLIVMRHQGGRGSEPPLVLVGKGLTFDAGGISLKPPSGMEDMKYDMSGGAAVIGAMRAIAQAKVRANVIGIVPSSENLPSGSATKPGDVIQSYAGKSIEVINTDAEGRLILADALAYAVEQSPAAIVDCATLTGAVVIALGHQASAVLGTDDRLVSELEKAGARTGERVWRLPLYAEYRKQLDSEVADLKNVGGRPAGTITAATFLKEFVGDLPWAHLDIAGTAYGDGSLPYQRKGALGVPTRLLFEWVRSRSA
ncbi:MAG: leucyl aminopeptidase [Gemmatimonadota bacterium]